MYGVDSFDAIVKRPAGCNPRRRRIVDRIVPNRRTAGGAAVLQLSVAFDHRVVDGARGAAFLETLASLVEEARA